MKGIYLVRHAPTSLNDPGSEKIRGWLDPPVTDEGRGVAMKRAAYFKTKPVERILYSPVERAKVMAEAIEHVTLAPIEADPRLKSWNMGDLQGRLASQVKEEIDAYMFQYPDKKVPGGESYRSFSVRFLAFLKSHWTDIDTVAVTHFRCMVLAAAYIKGDGVIDLATLKDGKKYDDIEVALVRPKSFTILKRSPEAVGVS